MTEINDKVFEIKVTSPYSFTIGDTSSFGDYQREGICEQVKVPKKLEFKTFGQSLNFPCAPGRTDLDLCDWEKFGRPELLHVAFNAVLEFVKETNELPVLNDQTQTERVLELAKQYNESDRGEGAVKAQIDEDVVRNVARFARAQISPLVSFWGGIIAQEVVKFTGKFTPLRQWLHYEFFEAVPKSEVNRTLHNTKYDDFIAIFGLETLQRVHGLKTFMVGAGALGCEYIKMFALMGLGSAGNGSVIVTDDDNIEISNLNRQFLFRKHNVGQNKSKSACNVGKTMNPEVRFVDKALRVSKENEEVFNDSFWEGLDIAVNAVDNIHARRYVDECCCYYGKPLFESGTLGTKCNSQLIIPIKTQSYSETQDPPEQSIPLCTLKNFPYQIDHTIQWGRDFFQGVFADGSLECIKYLEDPVGYIKKTSSELKAQPGVLRPRLETIKRYVEAYQVRTYEKCVELGRQLFQDIFYN
jgi:ubiquitin-activating enzyme E1